MPTFTTIALETLLEPRTTRNSSTLKKQQQQSHDDSSNNNTQKEQDDGELEKKIIKPRPPNHVFISPALYATPEPTPILDSSTLSGSISPSPYVFNRKGRGGGRLASVNRRIDGFEIDDQDQDQDQQQKSCDSDQIGGEDEVVDDNFVDGVDEKCVTDDDFFDPRGDSASVASSIDLNDSGRHVDNLSLVSNQGEYFDADEDFLSDGSVSSVQTCGRSIESELRATGLSLFEEIEKRKTAEDALGMMHILWQRVGNLLLSQTGLTFPVPSNSTPFQLEISSLEQFSQEVIVARFVAEAIGKGEARAEAELAAEVIIESKDQEISRLRDRLQYYEAMNREMSQRNLEVMEVARRQRARRRGHRRWLWSCLGISVAIGASVIAYSCLPQASEHHILPASSNQADSLSESS